MQRRPRAASRSVLRDRGVHGAHAASAEVEVPRVVADVRGRGAHGVRPQRLRDGRRAAAADYAKLLPWWAEVAEGGSTRLYVGEALYKAGDPAQPDVWQDPAELSRRLAGPGT